MALDDPLVWVGRILGPNHIFTFLCVWAEGDGYVRRTLDSPFLVLEECNRPLDEEKLPYILKRFGVEQPTAYSSPHDVDRL